MNYLSIVMLILTAMFVSFIGGGMLKGYLSDAERNTAIQALQEEQDKPETCITGVFVLETRLGLVAFGDQELCGKGLHFGPIRGPSQLPNPFNDLERSQ